MLKGIIESLPEFKSEDEARKRAIEDTKALFVSKSLLNNLDTIEDELRLLKDQTSQEDSIIMQKEIKSITEIHNIALQSKKEVTTLTDKLDAVQKQWKEASRTEFASHSDLVSLLILCTQNIDTLLNQIDTHYNMKSEINGMKQMLIEPNNIIEIYKKVKVFGFVYLKLIEKLEKDKRYDEISAVDIAFNEYHEFKQIFYLKIFELLRNAIEISKECPSLLVKLLQILESDDKYNMLLQVKYEKVHMNRPSNTSSKAVTSSKNLKEQCFEEIDISIENMFENRMSKCAGNLDAILKELYAIILDLKIVKEKTAPCFPPEYKIEEIYKTKYLQKVEDIVSKLIAELNGKTQGEFLIFASWAQSYEEFLRSIGISEERNAKLKAEIENTLPKFYDHLNKILGNLLTKLLKQEMEDEKQLFQPNQSQITLKTNFTVLLFKQINDEIRIVSEKILGSTLKDVIKVIFTHLTNTLKGYYKDCKHHLGKEKYALLCQRLKNMCECKTEFEATQDRVVGLFKDDNADMMKNACVESIGKIDKYMNKVDDCFILCTLQMMDEECYIYLFTPKWDSTQIDTILGAFIHTVEQLKGEVIKSEIELSHFSKKMIIMLVNAYIERMVYHCYIIAKKRWVFSVNDVEFLEISYKNCIADKEPKLLSRDEERSLTNIKLLSGIEKDIKTVQAFIMKNESFIDPKTSHEIIGKLNTIKEVIETSVENFDEAYLSFIDTFRETGKKLMKALLFIRNDVKDNKKLITIYDNEVKKLKPKA